MTPAPGQCRFLILTVGSSKNLTIKLEADGLHPPDYLPMPTDVTVLVVAAGECHIFGDYSSTLESRQMIGHYQMYHFPV